MTDLFLNAEQLHDLTGYRLASYQVRWLKQAGLQHWVRADGKPVVPVSAVTAPQTTSHKVRRGPDLAAVRRVN